MSLGSDSAQHANPDELDGVPGPGSVVVGKYRVERTIGVGGMGVVVSARHIQLNHLVAIKFLNEKTTQSATGVARFLREARASAALRSEHVARVVDVGQLESGAPFMVMEYLEGRSLSKLIRKRAPLPVYQAVDLVLQACDALGEAHERGIVHRDVKPSNLFLTKRTDGSTLLKVLDFGISKASQLTDDAEPTLTESYMVLGSPQYLSPEQIIDVRTVDARTDIWALGVVLYYMLAGVRPFEEDTVAALCVAIATKFPIRLIEHRPDIPPELDEVVMHCLQKDRQYRMASIPDLTRELAPFASGTPRTYVEAFDPPSSRVEPPSNVRTFSPGAPAHHGSFDGSVERVGSSVLVPESQAQMDLALPMAPTELMLRPRDSQESVIAVQAKPRVATATWLPIAGGLAIATVVVMFLVTRAQNQPTEEGNGPVSGAKEQAQPAATADEGGDVPERTVLVPGTAKPVASTQKKEDPKDGKLRKVGELGAARVQLSLLDKVGGQRVVGVVPAGSVLMIQRVAGEYALVTYLSDDGKIAVSGWTLRNLVQ
jgi:eukaryotic-like serine/threonine-protein kinase